MTEQLNWTEITHIHQIVYIHSHIQWKTQNLVSNVTETSILYRKNSLLGLFFTLTLLPHSQHFRHQMRGFSTILQQPAGCPTIQFSSDTLYQESVNDHTGQGFSPTTLPQFRCQFQAPDWYFEFTSYKSDFPLSPSQVWWLARKAHRIQGNTFTYWFTAKDKVEDTDEQGFHGSPDGKESACNVGEQGLIPGLIPPPLEEGMATHSSILAWRTPMDREAWWATIHGVAKSRTRLKRRSTLIIALRCCVSFCCRMKWIRCTHTYIYLYIYTHPLPPDPPSYPSTSAQSTELSSLGCTAVSH